MSLVHLDDCFVSLCYKGYIISGAYRRHATDTFHFSEFLTKYNEMPHICITDINTNVYKPGPYRRNVITDSAHINELGYAVLETDSDITRYATAPGYTDSNIDHILVPQGLVNCCSTRVVVPVAPSMSDHCLVYLILHVQRLDHLFAPKVQTHHFDRADMTKKEDYEEKLNAKLLAGDLLSESKNIQTADECVQVATGTQRELGVSLNADLKSLEKEIGQMKIKINLL